MQVKKNSGIVSVKNSNLWTGPILFSIFSQDKSVPKLRAPGGALANVCLVHLPAWFYYHDVMSSRYSLHPCNHMLQARSQAVMKIMGQILWHRHGRTSLKIRNGTILVDCQRERDPEYDSSEDAHEGYQMTFKFFLEGGQVSVKKDEVCSTFWTCDIFQWLAGLAVCTSSVQGMSSFARLIEESHDPAIHVLELIQHSEEFRVRLW